MEGEAEMWWYQLFLSAHGVFLLLFAVEIGLDWICYVIYVVWKVRWDGMEWNEMKWACIFLSLLCFFFKKKLKN